VDFLKGQVKENILRELPDQTSSLIKNLSEKMRDFGFEKKKKK